MDVPRGKRPTAGDRLTNIARAGAGLGMLGGTRMAKPVKPALPVRGLAQFAVVEHGDDGSASRPSALHVYWVGAATPANAVTRDFWYPAND